MAASNLNLGKASGGVLNIQPADGTTNTSIVLPASGTVTTNEYVNSSNLGNGSTTFNGFGGSGFKNYIINGNFDIWQRGTSFTSITNSQYTADRWITDAGVGVPYNISRQILPSGVPYLASQTTVSNSSIIIAQKVENQNRLVGKTLTLSATFYATLGETVRLYFSISGVGDHSYKDVVATGVIQFLSLTINIPSNFTSNDNNNFGIRILTSNNAKNLNVLNVQLEEGSVATPFEQRPYGLEMSLCQRYYQSFVHNGASGELYSHDRFVSTNTQIYISKPISFKVPMRTTPSVTIPRVYNQGTDYDTGWSVYISGLNNGMGGISIYKYLTMNAGVILAFDAIASAEL